MKFLTGRCRPLAGNRRGPDWPRAEEGELGFKPSHPHVDIQEALRMQPKCPQKKGCGTHAQMMVLSVVEDQDEGDDWLGTLIF